jgi:predicted nuclease with RNAse H fold
MKPVAMAPSFFIGWDVGGWNCDKNNKSRDAIVILDAALTIVGEPWRGNLRECITNASTTNDWLKALFTRCDARFPEETLPVTMAIDTPLGFSEEFVALVTRQGCIEPGEVSGRNRYLFRHTERHLFAQGRKPLSAIKDMIGSQATKGMHVLAKFAPRVETCGVWTDGYGLRVIETYPAACRKTKVMRMLLKSHKLLDNDDEEDAHICALVAHLFTSDHGMLEGPAATVPRSEGWIWVPGLDA